jgi:hypothetical protein
MTDRWPVEIDIQDYFPMERLLEVASFDRTQLDEIAFDIRDVEIKQRGDFFETELNTEDGVYRVHFWKKEMDIYEVTFRWDSEKLKLVSLSQYVQDFASGTVSTDKREPFKVFSFVISSVLSFIRHQHPKAIFLVANESKKVNSYQKLVHNISDKIGWKVHDKKQPHSYRAIIFDPEVDDQLKNTQP